MWWALPLLHVSSLIGESLYPLCEKVTGKCVSKAVTLERGHFVLFVCSECCYAAVHFLPFTSVGPSSLEAVGPQPRRCFWSGCSSACSRDPTCPSETPPGRQQNTKSHTRFLKVKNKNTHARVSRWMDEHSPACSSDAASFWRPSGCRWRPRTPSAGNVGSPGWWCLRSPPTFCGPKRKEEERMQMVGRG